MKEYDVVGVGRAYTDVIGKASFALLEEFGIPPGAGRYFSAEKTTEIQKKLAFYESCPGGATPNTLAGLAALGARTGLFGKAARDEKGMAFWEDMRARNIAPLCPFFVDGAALSGTCVVLLTEDGERSFALHKGCSDAFTEEDFSSFDFSRARYFLVYAKLLTDSAAKSAIINAIRLAKTGGCRVVASLMEIHDWKNTPRAAHEILVSHADILVGNESEVGAFFEPEAPAEDENRLVVTTQGTRGAVARQAGREEHVEACAPKRFVSSVGAGDQFLAGFLKGQIEGRGIRESLDFGARCAASILELACARPPAVSGRQEG